MIRWRMILRKAWEEEHDWDTELSGELHREVQQIYQDSANIPTLSLPRYGNGSRELVVYCDASRQAYP